MTSRFIIRFADSVAEWDKPAIAKSAVHAIAAMQKNPDWANGTITTHADGIAISTSRIKTGHSAFVWHHGK